jgi:hypothetical protein
VTAFGGAINKFTELSIAVVACHEIGHILGEVTYVSAGALERDSSFIGVEGEADYFAGICSNRYFRNEELTQRAIRETFSILYNDDTLDENMAKIPSNYFNKGINTFYPFAECRLLSALNGASNLPRPKCWYNP